MKRIVGLVAKRFVMFVNQGDVAVAAFFRDPLRAVCGAALGTLTIAGAWTRQEAGVHLAVSLAAGLVLWAGVLRYAVAGVWGLCRRGGAAP
jgi:spore maturation protein SpmA